MKDIIILGAGGSGWDTVSLINAINRTKQEWNILGFLDDNPALLGKTYCGIPVLDSIDACVNYKNAFYVSSIANPTNRLIRRKVWDRVKVHGLQFATLIHPSAILYDNVVIEEGCIINANCLLGNGAILRQDVHLAYACNIAHETELKEHVTLGTGVNLSSGVVIGEDCYIGAGVSSSHDVCVEADTLVSVGSAIITNIDNSKNAQKMWVGVPAVSIKEFVRNKLK